MVSAVVSRSLGVGAILGVGGQEWSWPLTCTSNEPMSIGRRLRDKPGPAGQRKWRSKARVACLNGRASGQKGMRKLGPPLSCSGPSIGSVLI